MFLAGCNAIFFVHPRGPRVLCSIFSLLTALVRHLARDGAEIAAREASLTQVIRGACHAWSSAKQRIRTTLANYI
jgi:hypothetical protein